MNKGQIWGLFAGVVIALAAIWIFTAIYIKSPGVDEVGVFSPATQPDSGASITAVDDANRIDPVAAVGAEQREVGRVDFVVSDDSDMQINKEKYLGSIIAIEGKIEQNYGSSGQAFLLRLKGGNGANDVVVLLKSPTSVRIEPGSNLKIVGVARRLTDQTTPSISDELHLERGLRSRLSDLNGKVAIVAESVAPVSH